MKYDIYISDINKKKILQLPIIPKEMPSIAKSSTNDTFETFNNGVFNIIGDVGLTEFELKSWLPAKGRNYSFQRVKNINPYTYIDFLNISMKNKKPVRVIITRGDGTYVINNKFSADEFEYTENAIGNFDYSIKLKQWRDY